jgi:multicomponent Na+:H+ antiporter subunit G
MTVRGIVAVCLLALGILVVVIAAVGMFRFQRTLELLQASALADTLGLLLILAALALLCGFTIHTAKLAVLAVILWAVNPVSAHLIARMEVITGLGMEPDQMPEEGEREL